MLSLRATLLPRSLPAAALRVPATRSHRKRIAGAVGVLLAVALDRHFAFENEQARIEFVSVLGIYRARLHAAIDDLPIALRIQFALKIRPVHRLLPREM